mgnify:CR=1 FL=1
MLGHCRSSVITVETERDFTMSNTPSELQARIRRLFVNRELETQFQKYHERVQPPLNVQEKPTRGVIRTNSIKTDTWE